MTEPIERPPPTGAPPPSIRPGGPGVPPSDVGGGGVLRGRTAGVPNWAFLAGAIGAGVVFLWWWNRRKTTAAATDTSGTMTGPATLDDTGADEAILAQIRDLQGVASTPLPTPTPTAPAPGRVYTVVSGDNLNSIASKLGVSWSNLYWPNAAVIEAAARAHGLPSSKGPTGSSGWWIYPGTRLVY